MAAYFVKRLLSGLLLIIGITIATFFIIRVAPGNPLSEVYDPSGHFTGTQSLTRQWGLELPIVDQFFIWIHGIIKGDLGRSFVSNQPVTKILAQAIPNTLILTVSALFLQVIFGTILGVFQIARKDSKFDRITSATSLVLYAVPSFWLALLMIMIFSYKLGWLPSSQMVSFGHESMPLWGKFVDRSRHIILPVISMSIVSIAATSRYVRNCMAEIMNQEYILAAKARGLSQNVILRRHALRNALVPITTLVGQHFPALVGSSIIIETIFSWPGMGRLIVISTFARDYPVIVACTFLMACFVVVGTLSTDIICAWIDPRIRLTR